MARRIEAVLATISNGEGVTMEGQRLLANEVQLLQAIVADRNEAIAVFQDAVEHLRAEVQDAHCLAYNFLPDRDQQEPTLCGQINVLGKQVERLQAIVTTYQDAARSAHSMLSGWMATTDVSDDRMQEVYTKLIKALGVPKIEAAEGEKK